MPPVSDELLQELAESLNKLINIPFLNEDQENYVLFFLLKMIASKIGILDKIEKAIN